MSFLFLPFSFQFLRICSVNYEAAMKSPAYKARVKCSTFGSKFSASAQDLRSLDIERERFDEDSPKGLIEACEVNLESEAKSPIQGTRCMPSGPPSRWRKLLKLLKRKSVQRLASIPSVQKISIKMGRSGRDNLPAPSPDANLCKMKASWKIFSFSELQKATNNFSPDNLIGRGGFAEVYKGCLQTGQLVAVKHVSRGTHEEAVTSFLCELGIIVHVDHPNTAKLIGYGVERELHIVLELSSLGSLASILYGLLEFPHYGMILGYVTLESQSGYQNNGHIITYPNLMAPLGIYFAPEYFMHGIADEKTDVYAFGVLLLELITGRRALDDLSLRDTFLQAKPLLDEHDIEKLVDPVLCDKYDEEEMDRAVLTASLCVQQTPVLRPRMHQANSSIPILERQPRPFLGNCGLKRWVKQPCPCCSVQYVTWLPEVVILLRGDDYWPESPDTSTGNQNGSMRRTYSEELLDAKEYNSTRQLNQMQRHRQVAFDSIL
ncbi:hypothetical protein Cgig2_032035 [Carnegiea gigantea]|uniref:Protein kinase domain-containing protein n=1 Tax=Carnegiea gigantea TaxID=171969 RepID=A0A9Q1K535_9CARY|nr:hypothetical protein Cgig2_032035 [Carnegiea gigantea]